MTVWKAAWLAPSETFIRNQVDSFRRWEASGLGLYQLPSPLVRDADRFLVAGRTLGDLLHRLFSVAAFDPLLATHLIRTRPQLVHVHFANEAFTVALVAAGLRIPFVVTVHGRDVTTARGRGGFKGARYRRLLRMVFRRAAKVIAVSHYIEDCCVALGAPASSVEVHHIGIPLSEDTLPDPEPIWDIIFVGRLVEKKGVADLLHAVSRLEGYRALRIGIIGSGPMQDSLRDLARSLDVGASFLGSLPPDEVRKNLLSAKIFVGPSKEGADGDSEGLGMVFLEAAAARLPVVSYRHGGVPEAVAHEVTGLLAPEGDVETLSRHMQTLLSDANLRAAFGAAGRARVEEDFEVTRQTVKLESLFDQIVSRTAGTR